MARTGDVFTFSGAISTWAGPATADVPSISGWNALRTELIAGLSDSFSRSGTGTMAGPFLANVGTEALPGISLAADPNSGFYQVTGDEFRLALGGTRRYTFKNPSPVSDNDTGVPTNATVKTYADAITTAYIAADTVVTAAYIAADTVEINARIAAVALKANILSPTFTGNVTMTGATVVDLPANTNIGTVTNTEISYLDNATSNIQAQLVVLQAQSFPITYGELYLETPASSYSFSGVQQKTLLLNSTAGPTDGFNIILDLALGTLTVSAAASSAFVVSYGFSVNPSSVGSGAQQTASIWVNGVENLSSRRKFRVSSTAVTSSVNCDVVLTLATNDDLTLRVTSGDTCTLVITNQVLFANRIR